MRREQDWYTSEVQRLWPVADAKIVRGERKIIVAAALEGENTSLRYGEDLDFVALIEAPDFEEINLCLLKMGADLAGKKLKQKYS